MDEVLSYEIFVVQFFFNFTINGSFGLENIAIDTEAMSLLVWWVALNLRCRNTIILVSMAAILFLPLEKIPKRRQDVTRQIFI